MPHDLVIGTYTEQLPHVAGHAEGVLAARFDGSEVSDVVVAARVRNPSWVCATSAGTRVYAVSETGPDGGLLAFSRSDDDALTLLSEVASGGADPAHLAVHPSGRWLIAGTYSGGTVAVFALNGDGSIGARTGFVQHDGRGPDDARQEAPHVHQLSVDPVTGDVVVVDLGLGEVRWYALDEEGALTLRPEATLSSGAAGPRHLAFHPDGRHAVVVNELNSTLDVLRRDGDRFVRVSTSSTRAPGATGANLPAAVRISGDGGTVIVSNRGDDTIAVFSFDPEVSRAARVATEPARGRTPRDLVIAPEGDRVLVACQDSDEVTVFAFDARTRSLRFLGTSPVPTPASLTFA